MGIHKDLFQRLTSRGEQRTTEQWSQSNQKKQDNQNWVKKNEKAVRWKIRKLLLELREAVLAPRCGEKAGLSEHEWLCVFEVLQGTDKRTFLPERCFRLLFMPYTFSLHTPSTKYPNVYLLGWRDVVGVGPERQSCGEDMGQLGYRHVSVAVCCRPLDGTFV